MLALLWLFLPISLIVIVCLISKYDSHFFFFNPVFYDFRKQYQNDYTHKHTYFSLIPRYLLLEGRFIIGWINRELHFDENNNKMWVYSEITDSVMRWKVGLEK